MKILETAKKLSERFEPLGVPEDRHTLKYTSYQFPIDIEQNVFQSIVFKIVICEPLKEEIPAYVCGNTINRNKFTASLLFQKGRSVMFWNVGHKAFNELENFVQRDIPNLVSCIVEMEKLNIKLAGFING